MGLVCTARTSRGLCEEKLMSHRNMDLMITAKHPMTNLNDVVEYAGCGHKHKHEAERQDDDPMVLCDGFTDCVHNTSSLCPPAMSVKIGALKEVSSCDLFYTMS